MPPKPRVSVEVGDLVTCWCSALGTFERARVVDVRGGEGRAYVSFVHQDKRLDDWITFSQIRECHGPASAVSDDRPLTRQERRMMGDEAVDDEPEGNSPRFEELHREVTKMRNIESITMGGTTMRAWYFSPYPRPYHTARHLYICEFCLRYFARREQLEEHQRITRECTPPGREIYRDERVSVFEMRGSTQKLPCQCLCLLGKLFLDHKVLFYDVEGFKFYVLCECSERGACVAGFISKEIESEDDNILSCIVVLPPFQANGYGKFLIALSYELARREGRIGSPERPLSDLGRRAFHGYWRDKIIDSLRTWRRCIGSLEDLSEITWIAKNDLEEALKELGLADITGEWIVEATGLENRRAFAAHDAKPPPKSKFKPHLLIWLPTRITTG